MVPVSPSTVMVMVPPRTAGLGPAKITETEFCAAWITVLSRLTENAWLPRLTAPASVGLRSNIETV